MISGISSNSTDFTKASTTKTDGLLPQGLDASALIATTIHSAGISSSQLSALKEIAKKFQELLSSDSSISSENIAEYEEEIESLIELAQDDLLVDIPSLENYGNKHANLIKLYSFFSKLDLQDVNIPFPRGVPSDIVEKFLLERSPEICAERQLLAAKLNEYLQTNATSCFFDDPVVIKSLTLIDSAISKAFAESHNIHPHPLLTDEIQAQLAIVKQNQTYLMVRSTGAEDASNMSNAGGNISKAYVAPEAQSFLLAAEEVVRSYFSIASFNNRINAKQNPFTAKLELAVTTQELIGEPIGGTTVRNQIPRSLVLYSSEPTYVNNEKFRVMRISAALGHGESVVNDKGMGCDTALILISESRPGELYVRYNNQDKPYRLAPVETDQGILLQKIENPEELKRAPLLTPMLIARLYHLGILTEKFFNSQPVDMEIVIKDDTIYPVQARKLNRELLLPSYIDAEKVASLKNSPFQQQLQAERILLGKGSVISINSPQQICRASTLAQAVKKFDGNIHRLVIVNHRENAECSHAITQFSEANVPCLLFANEKEIQNITAQISVEQPLIACIQTSKLYLWGTQGDDIQTAMVKGFSEHPARIPSSLAITEAADICPSFQAIVPADVKQLLLDLRAATTKEMALQTIKTLQQHPFVSQLKNNRKVLKSHLIVHASVPAGVKNAYGALKAIDRCVDRAFEELEAVWVYKNEHERLRPLFHAKVLETCLIGKPKLDGTLFETSVLDAAPIYQMAMGLISYQEGLAFPAHLTGLVNAGWHTFNTAIRQNWISFLIQLEPLIENQSIPSEQIDYLKNLVKTLQETNLMASWLTLEFSQMHADSPADKLIKLLNTFPDAESAAVHDWIQKLASTQAIVQRIDLFASQESFKEAWKDLKVCLGQFQPGAGKFPLDTLLKTHSATTCSIALKATHSVIELFDRAIKTMKGNADWPKTKKLKILKKMLASYLNVLENFLTTLIEPDEIKLHEKWPIAEYLKTIRQLLNEMPIDNPASLFASKHFSVHAAILGPNAFDRHYPKTHEDMFTLIHQNLLMLLAHLNQKQYSDSQLLNAPLPNLIKDAIISIPEGAHAQLNLPFEKLENAVRRLDLDVTTKDVTFATNITLRNHSAKLQISYDPAKETLIFKTFLLGDARRRWGMNKAVVSLLNDQKVLPLAEPINLGAQEVAFSWEIHSKEELNTAIEELIAIANKSLIGRAVRRDPQFIDLIERRRLMSTDGGVESLIKFAKKSYKRSEWANSAGALKVLLALVEKGHAYQIAEKYAIKGMQHADPFVQRCALQLLEGLVNQGVTLQTAEKFAFLKVNTIQTVIDPDTDLRLFSLDVCKTLAFETLKQTSAHPLPLTILESYAALAKIDVKQFSLQHIRKFLEHSAKLLFQEETVPKPIGHLLDLCAQHC